MGALTKAKSCLEHVLHRGVHGGIRSNSGHFDLVGLRSTCTEYVHSDIAILESLDIAIDVGAVFNFGFSPSGHLVAAVGELPCIALIDTQRGKLVQSVPVAHLDCINFTKFINDYQFATGSDDKCIKLWDVRHLKSELLTLKGHKGWVKNIEFCQGMLITSDLEGSVIAWDLKRIHKTKVPHRPLLHFPDLVRIACSLQEDKLVISTKYGHVLIFDNLRLDSLPSDFDYMRKKKHRPESSYNRMFVIRDHSSKLHTTSSMKIHPKGWCLATRMQRANHSISGEMMFVDNITFDADSSDEESLPNTTSPEKIEAIYSSYIYHYASARSPFHPTLPSLNREMFRRCDLSSCKNLSPVFGVQSQLLASTVESDVAQGIFKEFAFSYDGRMICSPYRRGVRFLSFSKNFNEICDISASQTALYESAVISTHSHFVFTTAASPVDVRFVSGGEDGKVQFYGPRL